MFFELLQSRRQGRLAHVAGFGGLAEMLLTRQGDHEFQLVDHESDLAQPDLAQSIEFRQTSSVNQVA